MKSHRKHFFLPHPQMLLPLMCPFHPSKHNSNWLKTRKCSGSLSCGFRYNLIQVSNGITRTGFPLLTFLPFLSLSSNIWPVWSQMTAAVPATTPSHLHVQQEESQESPRIPGDCTFAHHWLIPVQITVAKRMWSASQGPPVDLGFKVNHIQTTKLGMDVGIKPAGATTLLLCS